MALSRIDTAYASDSSKLKLPLAPSGDMRVRMSYQHPRYKQFIHNNRYIDSIWLNRYKKVVMYIDINLEQIYSKGLSIGLFRRLLVNQLNEQTQHVECPICKGNLNSGHPKLAIDHNHKTGKVRGVLHDPCNSGLGLFKEDISIMEKAIQYLQIDFSANLTYQTIRKHRDKNRVYKEMSKKQLGKCAICSKTEISNGKRLAIDHKHQDETLRMLLCNNCNTGLGLFKENIQIFKNAINYINYSFSHSRII